MDGELKKEVDPAKDGEKDGDGVASDEKLYGSKVEENPTDGGTEKSNDNPYIGRDTGKGSVITPLRNNMMTGGQRYCRKTANVALERTSKV